MKVKFSCNTCGEDFNISYEYLISKEALSCPNCSTEFPKPSFDNLKDGIIKLQKSKDELPIKPNDTSSDTVHLFEGPRIFDLEIIY